MEDPRFDGLFMSAIQQCQGIDNFYEALFSFMRRKTDFFAGEEKSFNIVNKYFKKHSDLFGADKVRQEAIKRKQAEVRAAQQKPQEIPKKEEDNNGATVEEVSDEEAKKIEEFQKLRERQEAAKNAPKKEGAEEDNGETKEEENTKQKPNAGNGG
jgi:hypothetical protein